MQSIDEVMSRRIQKYETGRFPLTTYNTRYLLISKLFFSRRYILGGEVPNYFEFKNIKTSVSIQLSLRHNQNSQCVHSGTAIIGCRVHDRQTSKQVHFIHFLIKREQNYSLICFTG